ncbi:hypothetical protein FBU30_001885 [Linnemannia zychae]|nr:hypothetical protein FBU30_001885 [Linnemannia zychae]
MGQGDAVAGAKLFKERCEHCHTLSRQGPHGYGPNLFGVYGREAGSATGYKFSTANASLRLHWTEQDLLDYLTDIKRFVPGTKKPFPGVKDPKEREDIVAYLKTVH